MLKIPITFFSGSVINNSVVENNSYFIGHSADSLFEITVKDLNGKSQIVFAFTHEYMTC